MNKKTIRNIFIILLIILVTLCLYLTQEVKVEESKPLQKDEYCYYQNYLIPISDECLENWKELNCSCDDIIMEFLEELKGGDN